MKKYIRTKDEIWLFGGTHHKGDVIIGKKLEIDFGYCFDKKDIINQADTIEELCDEFVVIGIFENQIGCCCDTFNEAKEFKNYVELPQIIYGAIWCEWGLKYVAKMNDKGELELL